MSLPMRSTGSANGLKGTGYRQVNTPTLSAETQQLLNMLRGGSQEGISSGMKHLTGLAKGDQSQFAAMEAPALRQFGEIQGNLASRYSGMGSGGRRSSGFKQESTQGATDLAERLQGNRLNMQNDAIKQLLGIGKDVLGTQEFDTNFFQEKLKEPGFLRQFLMSILGGIGGGASSAIGKWNSGGK